MFSPNASKYVGRVGALAIALGIGGVVATPPWLASADDSGSAGGANQRGGLARPTTAVLTFVNSEF